MKKKNSTTFERLQIIVVSILFVAPITAWGIWVIRDQKMDMRTYEIVKHFMCVCPMKCGMTLSSCNCPDKGGALERKAYIRDLLKQGLSTTDIMTRFNEKYGGLIK